MIMNSQASRNMRDIGYSDACDRNNGNETR